MFARTSPAPDRNSATHDPLPVRLVTAVVVLGLIAGGVAVIWGDLATRGGMLLPRSATEESGTAALAGPRPAALVPASDRLPEAAAASAGVRLLSAAAAACGALSYQGVAVDVYAGPAGVMTSVLQISHRRGHQTLVQPVAPALAQAHARHPETDPELGSGTGLVADGDTNGAIGMTPQMVALLAANYRVARGGRALVAGRPAQQVLLRRSDGAVAARFWLDMATNLPLRRQVFDVRARLVSDDAFLSLTLDRRAAMAGPAARELTPSVPLTAGQLARLRAGGWPLPVRLPGHLTLVQARQTRAAQGAVIDLAYSDGLSVVSLFLERGHLPVLLSGWSEVAVHGHRVFADQDQRIMAWSARGYVFTVITDAPQGTVQRVVAALPHGGGGFLDRISQGLHLMASWLNPFG
jgi:sigma-E factor negative regulatory protein RseB